MSGDASLMKEKPLPDVAPARDSAQIFSQALKLVVSDLTLARGERRVLAGLGFSVASGEALIVTGPNGAGKSTLLRALAGLLEPVGGRVTMEGAEGGPATYAHYLGHAEALKPALTARENLSFWAAMLGANGATPEAALRQFTLAHVAELPVGWLSAGQRRRVALARLLMAPRPVWLLDEPATALDAAAQANFAALMGAHLKSGGMIVAATHAPLGLAGARELQLGGAA